MQKNCGVGFIDQFIPENPLEMGAHGYEGRERSATTGAERIERDGLLIDSPEAVVDHLERIVFPWLAKAAAGFDEAKRCREILASEAAVQAELGPEILKTGFGFIRFPCFAYSTYGYANYFMAYALYPEVMERHFSLQADYCRLNNRAAARAYREGNLPPLFRLDYDMADSRGTLVNIKSLDRIWFPHFARSLEPVLKSPVRLIWHCDGNLMEMVPRLLEAGLAGFQGFQYEDGMDYERIGRMKTRSGEPLFIWAGVSVTRTLPRGGPEDVKRELDWLVRTGPPTGLVLGVTSSVAPGVSYDNLRTLTEGLRYYREHGRG
ncbi:MAG: hypothetical protein BWY73_00546 [candidate division TA06 bacterium ADurb.Bin417]|uniref:Uroporphyrinogen decarboxylase (URO-D) domain-containing protein n=1 Tax=candidate division TA06 bacterium ADurb.Bin417 TaxID=1852828 RepID=A0A1V5MI99_UNCT6|nr:MAG: hypothetical protein BWY73_00546 [candidate division TA06 bacterium ADurb.Bin417]